MLIAQSAILRDFQWFERLFQQRLSALADSKVQFQSYHDLPPPAPVSEDNYDELIRTYHLDAVDRCLLVAALLPQVDPSVLTEPLRSINNPLNVKYSALGGYMDSSFMNFLPTLQTVLFLVAGNDQHQMLTYHYQITRESPLLRERVLRLHTPQSSAPFHSLNQQVYLSDEWLPHLISQQALRADFSTSFPATYITTQMNWKDLILPDRTRRQLEELGLWVQHGLELVKTAKKVNPGYPVVFHGPPGTGKTLAAKLLGKRFNRPVYRIDLSMMVSKYIGETEKNLAHLFDEAQDKNWILFFDEADSLFTKRTDVGSSHDKWANLEVSYLLQRVEEFTGLAVLATNYMNNIDKAMMRRFQAIVHFPLPGPKQIEQLFVANLPDNFSFASNVELEKWGDLKLSGGHIANIIKTACLHCMHQNSSVIRMEDLRRAIKKEFIKENRTLNLS